MQIKSSVVAPKEGAFRRSKGINIKTDEVILGLGNSEKSI